MHWHLEQILCIIFTLFLTLAAFDVEVKVKQGVVIGTTEATLLERVHYYAFYGVPYARPPIGRLRFKDPVKATKWKYAFDATTEYSGACAQAHITQKYGLYGNEDCLYLNIYTPKLPKTDTESLKSVIVFIHGYAFTTSFSHLYGADFLIENDIVFVTVTHRIGVFGFLKLNKTDSNANMGFKDIVMALKWIKNNIKQFAGDKKKVTVMGSGSAATFLSWLMMTKSRRIFSKIILQSGGAFSPSLFPRRDNVQLEKLGQELLKNGAEDLLKARTEDIISAAQKIYNKIEAINYQRPLTLFEPTKEVKSNKSLLTTRPEKFFTSSSNSIASLPMLIGFNSQESISEVIPFIHNQNYLKLFSPLFKFMVPFSDGCRYDYTSKQYAEIAIKIKNEYFKKGISEQSLVDFLRYTSDLYKYPIYKFIKTLLEMKYSRIYMYKFNHVGKFNSVKVNSLAGANVVVKGAASGDELCYLLKCGPMWESYVAVRNDTSNIDVIKMKQMAKWWADFAKTGNPTPTPDSSYDQWRAIASGDLVLMLIGKESKLVFPKSEEKTFAFWNRIYDTYYRQEVCNLKIHDEL